MLTSGPLLHASSQAHMLDDIYFPDHHEGKSAKCRNIIRTLPLPTTRGSQDVILLLKRMCLPIFNSFIDHTNVRVTPLQLQTTFLLKNLKDGFL